MRRTPLSTSTLHLFYRRTGPWPAFTPDAFDVVSENPDPKLRIQEHGAIDPLPGPRLVWMKMVLPSDAMGGAQSLTRKLALAHADFDVARTGVLVADCIALYRAICRFAGWPDGYDASHWLAELPDNAVLQRRALERVCAA